MRLKPVLVATSIALLVSIGGCTKTESPKEVESSAATTVDPSSETTVVEVVCPTQLVVDSVNEEFANLTMGEDADVVGAMETMGTYVPSELEDDFETWQAAALDVVDLIEGIDPTKTESELTSSEAADLAQAQEIMDDEEVEEAQSNVKDHFRKACPDIVWSEESEESASSSTTELASGAYCPTEAEDAEILTQSMSLIDGPLDESKLAAMNAVYEIQASYIPSDLEDEHTLLVATINTAIPLVYGITTDQLDDPSTLSSDQQAAVAAFNELVDTEEMAAAEAAISSYFDGSCPDSML